MTGVIENRAGVISLAEVALDEFLSSREPHRIDGEGNLPVETMSDVATEALLNECLNNGLDEEKRAVLASMGIRITDPRESLERHQIRMRRIEGTNEAYKALLPKAKAVFNAFQQSQEKSVALVVISKVQNLPTPQSLIPSRRIKYSL